MVPMCNLKGRPVVYIPVRQYLQEFLYRDPMANHRL
jgi:hypothetical protein